MSDQATYAEHIYQEYICKHVNPLKQLEEVVRCRDCAHRRKAWNGQTPNFIVNWFCSYTGGHEVKPDGFCAWGEKGGDNIA